MMCVTILLLANLLLLLLLLLPTAAFSPTAQTRQSAHINSSLIQTTHRTTRKEFRLRNNGLINSNIGSPLFALPIFNWFQRNEQSPEGIEIPKDIRSRRGETAEEVELMHRTAKMMEDHRRSQEAAERTSSMMEELSVAFVVGRSKAGTGGIGLGGSGVKATFDGLGRPITVEVDPNFLFSESQGVISIDDLNKAITESLQDGYQQSVKLKEEKMKGLYEQLGLPKEGGK
jgi:DNA-binding protein YbaB